MSTFCEAVTIFQRLPKYTMYLSKVVQSLVEVSQHASRGLIGDLDGRPKYNTFREETIESSHGRKFKQ